MKNPWALAPFLGIVALTQGIVLLTMEPEARAGVMQPWLQAGEGVGDLVADGPSGQQIRLATGEPLFLLVFDPSCGHTQEAIPKWMAWLATVHPETRAVALTSVSREEGAEYMGLFGWRPEIWTVESDAGAPGRRPLTSRTPWIFLLDGEGVILAEGHGNELAAVAESWPGPREQPVGSR